MSNLDSRPSEPLDLLIIGGGPAGLTCALVAARTRLATRVLDAGAPRNAATLHSHGYFTRDGARPDALRAAGCADLERYPDAEVVQAEVVSVHAEPNPEPDAEPELWVATTRDGAEHRARRLVLATGMRDDLALLRLPGIEEVYGRSVFPCPFCDGYEQADRAIAVFASDHAAMFAPVVSMWSADVVVFTNGKELESDAHAALAAQGIPVETEPVRALRSDDGRLQAVVLERGREVARDAGFVAEPYAVPSPLVASLGIQMVPHPFGVLHPVTDEFGRTNLPRLYVIGDGAHVFAGLQAAAAQGHRCAAGIVHELAHPDMHASG